MTQGTSMEITATPNRRRRRVLLRVLAVLGLLLLVALLTPAALGMQLHPVTDDAMGDSYPRGTLVVDELVPVDELVVGDVIAFRVPTGANEGDWVARRIDGERRGGLVTRGDASSRIDPWRVGRDVGELRLVTGSVPLVGYVWQVLGAAGIAPWLVLLVVVPLLTLWLRRRGDGDAGAQRSGPSLSAPGAPVRPA